MTDGDQVEQWVIRPTENDLWFGTNVWEFVSGRLSPESMAELTVALEDWPSVRPPPVRCTHVTVW
jgi:hypothetical protein